MEEIIEIQGDLVRTIRREIINEVDLKDIAPHMETRAPLTLTALPRNSVRHLHWDESNPAMTDAQFLIELPPRVRTIDYDNADPTVPCVVALPYTIFNFIISTRTPNPQGQDWSLDNLRVYWARESAQNLDQHVIPALLPNIYADATVCWGNTGINAAQPLADRIDEIVNTFYLSTFTDHGVRDREWPWNRRTYKRWARETAADNQAWKTFPEWDLADTNVEHVRLRDLFTHATGHATPTLTDNIPTFPEIPTFGRAEEWLREQLDPIQRFRLRAALANVEADDPTTFVAPPPPVLFDEDDD